MGSRKKIFYLVLVLAIIVGAIIYYFIFMKEGIVTEYEPATSLQAEMPKIDTSALQGDAFQELKSYKALPLAPGPTGNSLPFQEINFLGDSTSTQNF